MGNEPSKASSDGGNDTVTDKVRQTAVEVNKKLQNMDASALIDNMCGGMMEEDDRRLASRSYQSGFSEDSYDDESRTVDSEDGTLDSSYYSRRTRDGPSDSGSALDQSEISEKPDRKSRGRKIRNEDSFSCVSADDESFKNSKSKKDKDTPVTDKNTDVGPGQLAKPLASSFAKRCYFTKAGIGKITQHYEGLTLTGNVVLMLATAMKLKGCPTICDEDLRRVEQTYPNQFSRLPDELLLSSGWRRISKFCHFSSKAIPDGVSFFRKYM